MDTNSGRYDGGGEAMVRRLVITVDGPAGSGKSTVSRILAERLDYMYLDTGLLYRAVAWLAMQRGVFITDDEALGELCGGITIPLATGGEMRVLVEGKDISGDLRTEEIGMLASSVSAIPAVRKALLPLQQGAGRKGGIVAEGRDMGTVVFPDADVKFFLDADVDERARRRHLQLVEGGKNADRNEVKRGLERRDHQDTTREIAPLKPAVDSVVIDTTGIDIEGVVEEMAMIVEERAQGGGGQVR
ncbi:MAG: (d)CMP kinase [Deltaproteobacteria bacterium]|nr:(d)CMP kinase [Deltaproteobacteria bacterium]